MNRRRRISLRTRRDYQSDVQYGYRRRGPPMHGKGSRWPWIEGHMDAISNRLCLCAQATFDLGGLWRCPVQCYCQVSSMARSTNLENLNKGRVMPCPSRIFLVTLLLLRKVIGEAIGGTVSSGEGKAETSSLTLWRPSRPVPMSSVPSRWGSWVL